MKCDDCGKERKGERLGGGWKKHGDMTRCPTCWGAKFMLRAITVSISGPVGDDWNELRDVLRKCWDRSTMLANWHARELAKADVARTAAMEKLPPFKSPYLYNEARAVVPDMDTGSVVELLNESEGRYRERRYEVIWLQQSSMPTYTWPQPYPVHNQRWSLSLGKGGELLLSVPLLGERRTLRLGGGPGFARQRKALLSLIDGRAIQCAMAIYPQVVSENTHRTGMAIKIRKGGETREARVMAKLVLWLPKPEAQREPEGVLRVTTNPENFWTALKDDEDEEPRSFHADHVRQFARRAREWIEQYTNRKDKLSDDRKLARRQPAIRKQQVAAGEKWARKQQDRLDTFAHQATAMLADYARRRRVAKVIFDHSDHSYFPSFPWFELVNKLRYKLDGFGIELEVIEAKSDAA